MAIYLHVFNFIINKQAVAQKYNGGAEKFRMDHNHGTFGIFQEDDELFAFGQMDTEPFDFDQLILNGLNFNRILQKSDDFVILYRYGDMAWEVNWLENNKLFAWHISTDPEILSKVHEISNMTMKTISDEMDRGNDLFKTIRKGSF